MVFYFVQRGETLYAIAKRYQTTVHAIVAANRLEDPNAICPGQALIIPRPGEVPSPPPGGIVHLVRQGETVFHLAAKFRTTPHDILKANQVAHPEFILPGQQLVIPEPSETWEDWPMFGRTPGRSGSSPVELDGIPLPGWSYAPRRNLGIRPSAPVIRYERVFVGLGDGYFYSLDRNSGRVKWRIPGGGAQAGTALGGRPMATPAVVEGLAYLCGADGVVYCVDAHSGHHIWKLEVGSPLISSPAAYGGVLYLGVGEDIYAIEAKTGAIAWKQSVGAAIEHPVAVGDDHVFAVSANGQVIAVESQTGEICWRAEAAVKQAPVFGEILVLVGGKAFDPGNGQVMWETDGGRLAPVARVDQIIYPGRVVDLFTGTLRKGSQLDAARGNASLEPPPLISLTASGSLIVGAGEDGRLYALSIENASSVVWSIDLEGPCSQPPAVASGQVVVTLNEGMVKSFRMKTER